MYRISKNLDTSNFFYHESANYKKNIGDFVVEIFDENNKYFIFEDDNFFVLFDGFLYKHNPDKYANKILEGFLNKKLSKLNGIFIALVIDKRRCSLSIINDKYGLKPFYIFKRDNRFVVSTKIDLILHRSIKYNVDWRSWSDFFVFTYLLGNKTHFQEIKKVCPASLIKIEKNVEKFVTKYWDYKKIKQKKSDISDEELIDECKSILQQVVQDIDIDKNYQNDQIIVNLSGGYDSRLVIGSLTKFGNIKPHTFTSEKYPDDKIEVKTAKKVAKIVGCQNNSISLPSHLFRKFMRIKYELVEYSVQEHIWMLPLADHYRKRYINIDGYLGDGILGNTYSLNLNQRELYHYLAYLDTNIIKLFVKGPLDKIKQIAQEDFNMEFKCYKDTHDPGLFFLLSNRGLNCVSYYIFNIVEWKIKSIPFFFHDEFLKFCLSLPKEKLYNHCIYKKILQNIFPELYVKRANALKMNILAKVRKIILKVGLMQIIGHKLRRKYWFKYKVEDAGFIQDSLKKCALPTWINQHEIDKLIEKSKKDSSVNYHLEQVLVLGLWLEKYKDLLIVKNNSDVK